MGLLKGVEENIVTDGFGGDDDLLEGSATDVTGARALTPLPDLDELL